MNLRLLSCILCLLPAAAWAQTGTLILTWPGQSDQTGSTNAAENIRSVGPGNCEDAVSVAYQAQLGGTPCTDLKLWITSGTSCADDPGTSDLTITSIADSALVATPIGTATFDVADLPIFTSEAGKACNDSKQEKELLVCASVKVPQFGLICGSTGQLTLKPVQQLKVKFDSSPPEVPVLSEVEALDSALAVKVETSADTATLVFDIKVQASGNLLRTETVAVSGDTVRIRSLENGVAYQLVAYAEDAAGNRSEASAPISGKPVLTDGFWAIYQQAEGTETGGCSSAGGGFFPVGLLMVARWFSRRKRS